MNMLTFNQEGSNVITIIRSDLISTPKQAMPGMQAVYSYKEYEFRSNRCMYFCVVTWLHEHEYPASADFAWLERGIQGWPLTVIISVRYDWC